MSDFDRQNDMSIRTGRNTYESLKFSAAMVLGTTAVLAVMSSAGSENLNPIDTDESYRIKTGAEVHVSELVIGAADGMKELGWSNAYIEKRVDAAIENSDSIRKYMSEDAASVLDVVRQEGKQQALDGKWSEDALNGYLDTLEATDARVRNAVTAMGDETRPVSAVTAIGTFFYVNDLDDEGSDRKMYEMSSAAFMADLQTNAWSLLEDNKFSTVHSEWKPGYSGYPLMDVSLDMETDPQSVSMNYVVPSNRTTVEFADVVVSDPFAEGPSHAISLEEDFVTPN